MAQVLAKCDLFRAQITHLRTVFPYVQVAPYTKGQHAVKVYVDLQWRCQVCLCVWVSGLQLTGVAVGSPQNRWNLAHCAFGSRSSTGEHGIWLSGWDGIKGGERASRFSAFHTHWTGLRLLFDYAADQDASLPLQGRLLLRARVPAGALAGPPACVWL